MSHERARQDYDAIVVGSGVGGSVTAALLAHDGLSVLVLEKNARTGGILASALEQGFKLDVGSHLVARGDRGPLGAVLRRIGLDRPRFLTHRIPVRSRGMFEIAAPPTRAGLPAAALEAADRLGLPARERLRLFRMMVEVFTLSEAELRVWDRRTLDDFIRQHTDHPGAYFLFAFLASIFFVLPPWETSAGESIRALRRLILDYRLSYVEGGMDAYTDALLSKVRARGDVVVSSAVTGIHRAGEKLVVETADGRTFRAPWVACNMAAPDLVDVVGEAALPSEWIARVRALRPSGNAHQLKLGLRRPLVDEGCLIGGISLEGLTLADLSIDLMHRTVADIDAGRVSDPLSVYAPVPTNYDPSLAPDGGQIIVASIYGPTRADPIDPPERWKERALAAMASVIPNLHDELVFAELVPIPTIGHWMGKRSRGAICNGQVPGQVGADRLPVATPIDGLFICGDGAGGRGIGMELAAASAIEVAESILARAREAAA